MKGSIRLWTAVAVAIFSILLSGCSSVDDDRVPLYDVYLRLDNYALWEKYGVFGYGDSRRFIRSERVPADYPYAITEFTGFGGILLVAGADNGDYSAVLAYDLACPVEAKPTVRVYVDDETFDAVCPQCGSRYNVCEGFGGPVSGPAAERKYGLRRYRALSGDMGGYIIVP